MCLERSLSGDLLVAIMIELRALKRLGCVQDLLFGIYQENNTNSIFANLWLLFGTGNVNEAEDEQKHDPMTKTILKRHGVGVSKSQSKLFEFKANIIQR